MAADKYLDIVAGVPTQRQATVVSTGATEAGDIVALGTDGKLDTTVMPTGIGAETKALPASEALSANDMVNIYDATGTSKCRKADASNGRRCHGFVKAAVDQNATATVYLEGQAADLTGKTIGAKQFLSASTAGAMTETPPSGSGNLVQEIGIAVDTTEVRVEPQVPYVLA